MNIHEYQSKAILRSYGVNVPAGKPAFSVEEAVENARELGTDVVVVKAQIHAGGRGKAGGVKVVHSLEAVEKAAEELLGKVLVTHQTGPAGKARQPPAHRGRSGHQEGILSFFRHRPPDGAHRHDGLGGGRHGDREGRR